MVDLDNGFNTGDRWILLEEVKAHFPQLYPWVVTCYGQHSHLKFGDHRLSSEAGRCALSTCCRMRAPARLCGWLCGRSSVLP